MIDAAFVVIWLSFAVSSLLPPRGPDDWKIGLLCGVIAYLHVRIVLRDRHQ